MPSYNKWAHCATFPVAVRVTIDVAGLPAGDAYFRSDFDIELFLGGINAFTTYGGIWVYEAEGFVKGGERDDSWFVGQFDISVV